MEKEEENKDGFVNSAEYMQQEIKLKMESAKTMVYKFHYQVKFLNN